MKRNKKAILLSLVTAMSLTGCKKINDEKIEEHTIIAGSIVPSNKEHIPSDVTLPTVTIVAPTPTVNPEDIFYPVNAFAYLKNTDTMYDSYKYDKREMMPMYQFQKVFVISTNGICYNIQTEKGNTGYIACSSLEILPENYVEVDLSDQKVTVVDDYETVLYCDVVTGGPGTETNEGYTEILEKTYNRPLIGPTWNVDVDYFFPFNYSAEGFHDASWRSSFGGDIHTYNGSHGCVNMTHQDVQVMDNHVEVGTKVLVHK